MNLKINTIDHPFTNINSVLLIDNNEIDNFINRKMLLDSGAIHVTYFNNAISALLHLRSESYKYDLILINVYLPVMDGFEFIESFNKSDLNKIHGKICLLSSVITADLKKKSNELSAQILEKPLTIDKLQVLQPP